MIEVTPQEHVAQAALEVSRLNEGKVQACDTWYEGDVYRKIAKAFMELAERLEPE